ncbi:MAG: hypothetical protein U0802_12240 [Candidatus Binatia bacterium]
MTADDHLDLLTLDAIRSGEPPTAPQRAHLAWCEPCRATLDELGTLAAELRRLPPAVEVPPARDAVILAMTRRRAATARRAHWTGPARRWAVAALLLVLCAPLAPSVASLDPTVGSTLDARWPGRAMVYGAAGLLLALALARPWHWQRRYGDGGWLLALVCLGVPPGWAARQQLGAAALATAVPFLAVLAGAWWEGGLAAWRRRVAGAAVVLCLVTALLPLGAAAIHRTRSAVGSVSARPGAVA